jgi:hypothetical protein
MGNTSSSATRARTGYQFLGVVVAVLLVPSIAFAHGQQFIAPLAGSVAAFVAFSLWVVLSEAPAGIKLAEIAAFVLAAVAADALLLRIVTPTNAAFVAAAGALIPTAIGLVPWQRWRRRRSADKGSSAGQ